MECKECYSEDSRITPILKAHDCLSSHTQYICNTCGRCICIDHTKQGLQRWMFPFKTQKLAICYLRCADVSVQHPCGIYRITNEKGRESYKIFVDEIAADRYRSTHRTHTVSECLFQKEQVFPFDANQIRTLSRLEIEQYLQEQAEHTGKTS